MQSYNYLLRMKHLTKKSHLCSMMFKQPIQLLLIKIELMSKLMHGLIKNIEWH